ncbi:MAG: ABC transporter substrate-binding protein [Oscillospiraceae bacterium]|nr:ABC transporter substrate-binding protein [Oscillospiraceae bacterium]
MRAKRILFAALALCLLLGCSACGTKQTDSGEAPVVGDLKYERTVPLEYADQFAIYKYEGGYSLIDMNNSDRMLVVPEGKAVPGNLDRDIVVVQQPLSDIYLAATSAMALFESLDALESISFVGSKHWYTDEAEQAYQDGLFVYAGKYNAPDYEQLINGKCQLAIQSTMILHNPEVKEKLIELGIKTVVERSSYENHPLGRTEWIKVYGALLGKEAEAEAAFEGEVAKIRELESLGSTGKTAAFFYVNTSGNVVTYKTEGYVPAMIRIAGGEYIFTDLGLDDDSKLSTINMNMEEFYNTAKNADVIIYNCSIASQLYTMDDLLSLSPVLEDFKAVQENNVWCTTESMFQQTDKMGTIIQEMNRIFSETATEENMHYIFHLQ